MTQLVNPVGAFHCMHATPYLTASPRPTQAQFTRPMRPLAPVKSLVDRDLAPQRMTTYAKLFSVPRSYRYTHRRCQNVCCKMWQSMMYGDGSRLSRLQRAGAHSPRMMPTHSWAHVLHPRQSMLKLLKLSCRRRSPLVRNGCCFCSFRTLRPYRNRQSILQQQSATAEARLGTRLLVPSRS
jgi:hypothetical protein